jgi:diphthamide synthase (EF-2-diphthine--ammonia ligase)
MQKKSAFYCHGAVEKTQLGHCISYNKTPLIEVVGLLTTFNSQFKRSAIHGVRQQLLRGQAQAANLPLIEIPLPWPCSNQQYEAIMASALDKASTQLHMDAVAFGDLYLEDIRHYREQQMATTGLELLFPLWQIPTDQLARQMIDGGLKATITCLDPRLMPEQLAGWEYNDALLEQLPDSVDPCGEEGEFHTFAWDGPMFAQPIVIRVGEVVNRDGFVYADLLLENG